MFGCVDFELSYGVVDVVNLDVGSSSIVVGSMVELIGSDFYLLVFWCGNF